MIPAEQDPNPTEQGPTAARQGPSPPEQSPSPAKQGPAEQDPSPAERGRLQISGLVLRKIAEHAASLSPGAIAASQRRGRPPDVVARVRTDGQDVDVELDVALVYPQPVRETARRLRAAVSGEIDRLTGRNVRRVAVTVVALRPHIQPRVR